MKHGGDPCGDTSETKACNTQGCEQDCMLASWTSWSKCSKDCDGGTKKRQKFVFKQAQGAGLYACFMDILVQMLQGLRWRHQEAAEVRVQAGPRSRTVCLLHGHPGPNAPRIAMAAPRSGRSSCSSRPKEQDCMLASWTSWSKCSKDCDGGTKK